jgi:8-oxo-dGTP pyrophosphatase MutT (NUDIX family)
MSDLRWKTAAEPQVTYALEDFPDPVTKSMFLAGPTPRGDGKSWRAEAIEYLKGIGYSGHVFIPEPRDGAWAEDYIDQVEWEDNGLNRADVIVFWVPRDLTGETYGCKMAALTTNDEWGDWKNSGKVVFGAPSWAEHVRYQQHYAKELGVPLADSLEGTLQNAVSRLGEGALRTGGRTQVPLCIWDKPEFQRWLSAQENAGNRLDGCKVLWTFWVGPKRDNLYSWALHVDMHVGEEDRQKDNEYVIFRKDLASVVLYGPLSAASRNDHTNFMETGVVLVREFRSAARNRTGFVTEIPGGGVEDTESAGETALKEVSEEIGFEIAPERLEMVETRQLASTLLAHTGAVYAVELSADEMAGLVSRQGEQRSSDDGEERTALVVREVRDILRDGDIDWSMLGMIWAALEGYDDDDDG